MFYKENISNTPYESIWSLEDQDGRIIGECVINNRMGKEYYSLWKKYTRSQIKEMFDNAVTFNNRKSA